MVPFELLPWCGLWSQPRIISSLSSAKIAHVTAGDMHTMFLASSGRLYMCGVGFIVPPFEAIMDEYGDENEDYDLNGQEQGGDTTDRLKQGGDTTDRLKQDRERDQDETGSRSARSVTSSSSRQSLLGKQLAVGTPRCASSLWMSRSVCVRVCAILKHTLY